ncbi:MAG TPA: hypothetical protein VFG87_25605 [Amycolatopsis sp.]|jgi:hypothetical protein|nr:hypothetical protein [Amycolatopsis sp.]
MYEDELIALQLVADNEVLFHPGMCGGPVGYRWRGPDGAEAGQVPQRQTEVFDRLTGRGLVRIERRLGPFDREMSVTSAGFDALGVLPTAA